MHMKNSIKAAKNMRRWIGHTVRAGHDKRVQHVIFFLKELIDKSQTRSIKDDGITSRCDFKQPLKQLVIDEAFWKSLEAYRTSEVARGDIIKLFLCVVAKLAPPPSRATP